MKKLSLTLLLVCLLLGLTACGKEEAPPPALTLVQGNLDAVYHGTCAEDYLSLTGLTAQDCLDAYEANLKTESGFFLSAFGYLDTGMSDETRAAVEALYQDIYRGVEYTVGPAAQLDDETQAVKVQVTPLKLFQTVLDDTEGMAAAFAPIRQQYYWMDPGRTDWTNPAIYGYSHYYPEARDAYVNALVELCRAHLADTPPGDPQTVVVQVYWHPYGYWAINDADWQAVDALMIEYP